MGRKKQEKKTKAKLQQSLEFARKLKKKKREKKTTWICDLLSDTNPNWNVRVIFRQMGRAHENQMPDMVEAVLNERRTKFGREPSDLRFVYKENFLPEGQAMKRAVASLRKELLQSGA